MPEEVIKNDTLEDDSGNINNIEDQESYNEPYEGFNNPV